MVTGLNVFRDYFADDTDKYVLIMEDQLICFI